MALGIGLIAALESRRPVDREALGSVRALPPATVPGEAAGDLPHGRIVLDLDMLDIAIVPGEAGSEIRLEGSYDRAGYELIEEYATHADGSWSYRLELEPLGVLNEIVYRSDRGNDLRLVVPPDRPISIDSVVHRGGSHFDLGGLWLVEAELEFGIGGHVVAFSRPLKEPMRRLEVDSSIGRLQLQRIGNASPRVVVIDKLLGRADVDLDGAWRSDAELKIDGGFGGCRIEPPDATVANISVTSSGILMGDSRARAFQRDRPESTPGLPQLTLRVEGALLTVEID